MFAREVGKARSVAAMLRFGWENAQERDQFTVRGSEDEERAVFEARQYAPTS